MINMSQTDNSLVSSQQRVDELIFTRDRDKHFAKSLNLGNPESPVFS